MLNKYKKKILKNPEIIALIILTLITIISTTYYNHSKKKIYNNYKEAIDNIYLKKTINYFFNSLEPKYKKITHKISEGETFDNILTSYSIDKSEIQKVKKKLSEKVNLNKLNTNQKIQFTLDQSSSLLKEFIFQISNTEKIFLMRDTENKVFNQKILVTKLKKDVVYKENIILTSLYKSAVNEKIPVNTIIEFARIYGFQVDFQRDIKKRDSFQIMYEVFTDDNGKVIETGNIIFANLKLSGQDNSLYYFDKEGSEGHYDKSEKALRKH